MTLYRKVYTILREEIETGILTRGTRLPADENLGERFSVSKITISKALRLLKDDGYITRSPKKGTYVASLSASPIIKKNKATPIHTLGLVIPSFNDLFGANFLKYFLLITNQNYNVVVKLSNSDYSLESEMISKLIDDGAEAIVLLPTSSTIVSPIILDLITSNFPIIILDRTLSDLPICSILTDNTRAAYDLTKYLIRNGHKTIGMLTHSSNLSSVSARKKGFQDAHFEYAIPMSKNQIQEFGPINLDDVKSTRTMIDHIKQFLIKNSNCTAVFCEEYAIVYHLMVAALELGKSIPDDLSIVCVDHPPKAYNQQKTAITHIRQNEVLLAKKTLELITFKIANPKKFRKEIIAGQIVHGNSVNKI